MSASGQGRAPRGAPRPGFITQSMLRRYLADREVACRCAAQREELLAMLDGGAAVEPGPLGARDGSSDHRRLTAATLAGAVGPESAAEILGRVAPTRMRRLVVTGCEVGWDDPVYEARRPAPRGGRRRA